MGANATEDCNIYGVNRPNPFPNALDLLYLAILLVGSPVVAYRLFRSGKWRSDWRGRFGHASPLAPDPRPTVLLHGVSVGEVAAADPLDRFQLLQYPQDLLFPKVVCQELDCLQVFLFLLVDSHLV